CLIDTNPAADSVFEVEVSKNIGREAQLVFSSYPEFLEILETMKPTEIHLLQDGLEHIYDVRVSFLSGSTGSKIGRVIALRDITERKRAEKTTLESEARYRQIFNIAPAGIYEIDYRTGKFVSVNDVICEYSGYTRDELLSMNALEILTKESQARFLSRLDKIARGEDVPKTVEFSVLRKDGSELMTSINVRYVYEGQDIVGATAVAQDISERKKTEAVLHLQHDLGIALSGAINLEEVLTLIVNTACKLPDMDCGGVYLVNQDTKDLDLLYSKGLSPQFVKKISYYGKDSDQAKIINSGEAIFTDYSQLKIAKDPVKRKEKVRAIAILPISHIGKAIGALNVASHSINRISLQTRQHLETIASQVGSAIARVIAEENKFKQNRELKLLSKKLQKEIDRHKLTEKTLELEKERLRILTENSPFGISLISADGRYLYLNPKFIDIFGYELEDIPTGKEWFQKAFPDREYRDQIISAWIQDQKAFGVGETRPRTFATISKGNIEKLIHFRPVALESKQQLIIYEDITEKNRLESQLQRSQRMEAIGTLAGGVAHDLNNILSAQVSYPDLILMDLSKDSLLREPILTIQKSGKKAAAIVQDLLTLARRGVVATEVVSLNDIIEDYIRSPECENLMAFHPGVKIKSDLEPGLLNIKGSSFHLATTVTNMCSNAAEAMPMGGNISISTRNKYMDLPVKGYENIKAGDYVILTVSDSGAGISPEDLEKIFEPFYTKKVMGRSGTGLGMAVVWGTVKDHEGYIEVQSTEGIGTTFNLYFSVTRKEIGASEEALSMEAYMGKGESILVVDDVEAQREIAFKLLDKLNYAVTSVSSGEEAVDYMKNNSVDLLVLDMIMDPGIDGLATYQRILELHPGQKAIIASGFSETDMVKKAQRLGAGKYLKKPYTLEQIGLAIKAEFELLRV
ncbi:MAG: PAS domain S-box protein, partial [Nitrospinales bacterium]